MTTWSQICDTQNMNQDQIIVGTVVGVELRENSVSHSEEIRWSRMTRRRSDHHFQWHSRRVAMLAAIAASVLFCACSSNSGTPEGVLKGTALPCIGPVTYKTPHAWEITVTLRRGSTVISTRRVLDTQAAGQSVIQQLFTFTEPGGSYTISGPTPKWETVVIKAGKTSTVELTDACK
jgi:hypothetical protein